MASAKTGVHIMTLQELSVDERLSAGETFLKWTDLVSRVLPNNLSWKEKRKIADTARELWALLLGQITTRCCTHNIVTVLIKAAALALLCLLLQDSSNAVSVTVNVDPKGFFLYWQEANKVGNCILQLVATTQSIIINRLPKPIITTISSL